MNRLVLLAVAVATAFGPADALATKEKVELVPPPTLLRVTDIRVTPAGPWTAGDEILVECTVRSDGQIDAVYPQLGFASNTADAASITRWMVDDRGKTAAPWDEAIGAFTVDRVLAGTTLRFMVRFRAKACGRVGLYFAYGYNLENGKTARSWERILDRCVGPAAAPPPVTHPAPDSIPKCTPPVFIWRPFAPPTALPAASAAPLQSPTIGLAEADSCGCGHSPE